MNLTKNPVFCISYAVHLSLCLDLDRFSQAQFVTKSSNLHQVLHWSPVTAPDSHLQGGPSELINFLLQEFRELGKRLEGLISISYLNRSFRLNSYKEDALLYNWFVRGLCTLGGLYVTGFDTGDTDHAKEQDQNDIDEPKNVACLPHDKLPVPFL